MSIKFTFLVHGNSTLTIFLNLKNISLTVSEICELAAHGGQRMADPE